MAPYRTYWLCKCVFGCCILCTMLGLSKTWRATWPLTIAPPGSSVKSKPQAHPGVWGINCGLCKWKTAGFQPEVLVWSVQWPRPTFLQHIRVRPCCHTLFHTVLACPSESGQLSLPTWINWTFRQHLRLSKYVWVVRLVRGPLLFQAGLMRWGTGSCRAQDEGSRPVAAAKQIWGEASESWSSWKWVCKRRCRVIWYELMIVKVIVNVFGFFGSLIMFDSLDDSNDSIMFLGVPWCFSSGEAKALDGSAVVTWGAQPFTSRGIARLP